MKEWPAVEKALEAKGYRVGGPTWTKVREQYRKMLDGTVPAPAGTTDIRIFPPEQGGEETPGILAPKSLVYGVKTGRTDPMTGEPTAERQEALKRVDEPKGWRALAEAVGVGTSHTPGAYLGRKLGITPETPPEAEERTMRTRTGRLGRMVGEMADPAALAGMMSGTPAGMAAGFGVSSGLRSYLEGEELPTVLRRGATGAGLGLVGGKLGQVAGRVAPQGLKTAASLVTEAGVFGPGGSAVETAIEKGELPTKEQAGESFLDQLVFLGGLRGITSLARRFVKPPRAPETAQPVRPQMPPPSAGDVAASRPPPPDAPKVVPDPATGEPLVVGPIEGASQQKLPATKGGQAPVPAPPEQPSVMNPARIPRAAGPESPGMDTPPVVQAPAAAREPLSTTGEGRPTVSVPPPEPMPDRSAQTRAAEQEALARRDKAKAAGDVAGEQRANEEVRRLGDVRAEESGVPPPLPPGPELPPPGPVASPPPPVTPPPPAPPDRKAKPGGMSPENRARAAAILDEIRETVRAATTGQNPAGEPLPRGMQESAREHARRLIVRARGMGLAEGEIRAAAGRGAGPKPAPPAAPPPRPTDRRADEIIADMTRKPQEPPAEPVPRPVEPVTDTTLGAGSPPPPVKPQKGPRRASVEETADQAFDRIVAELERGTNKAGQQHSPETVQKLWDEARTRFKEATGIDPHSDIHMRGVFDRARAKADEHQELLVASKYVPESERYADPFIARAQGKYERLRHYRDQEKPGTARYKQMERAMREAGEEMGRAMESYRQEHGREPEIMGAPEGDVRMGDMPNGVRVMVDDQPGTIWGQSPYNAKEQWTKIKLDTGTIHSYGPDRMVTLLPDTEQPAALNAPEKRVRKESRKVRRLDEPEGEPEAPTGAGQPGEPISKADITRRLAETLHVPIRVGHMGPVPRSVKAFFKIKPEVIRSKIAHDIRSVSHEVGHLLEKRMGFDEAALGPYANELTPLVHPEEGGRIKGDPLSEGLAEYVSHYIRSPADAKQEAPRFTAIFEARLRAEWPEALEALVVAQKDFRRWNEQPALARVMAQISTDVRPGKRLSWRRAYRLMLDDLEPLQTAVKSIDPEGRLPADQDAYKVARIARAWSARADEFIRHGPFRYGTLEKTGGKGLEPILQGVHDRLDDFRGYLLSRRTLELAGKGIETGIDRRDAQTVVDQLKSPQFEEAANALYRYQHDLLAYLKDSGILGEGAYKLIREQSLDYVPLYRVMEDVQGGGPAGARRFVNLYNPIRKIKGSGREIVDPLESIVKNTHAFLRLAEMNRVARTLVENMPEGRGDLVEPIPRKMTPQKITKEELIRLGEELGVELPEELPESLLVGFRPSAFLPKDEPIVTVHQRGVARQYRVHPELYEALAKIDPEQVTPLMQVLGAPARLQRSLVTTAPRFIARNLLRDPMMAWVQSKYGFNPLIDWPRGFFNVIGRTDLYREFKRSGAAMANLQSLDRVHLSRSVKELAAGKTARQVAHPLEVLRMIGEAIENTPRMGEYLRARKAEGRDLAGLTEAGFAGREVTLDFLRFGQVGRTLNTLTAFFNARLQGPDRLARAFKENPTGVTIKMAGMATASLMLWAANHDDQRYRDMPQWQKDANWVFLLPEKIMKEPILLPKPFEVGMIFGSLPERMLEWWKGIDPRAARRWAVNFMKSQAPDLVPTLAQPSFENAMNWSRYRDRPLTPQGLQNLDPSLQATRYTSESARFVAETLAELGIQVSPIHLENYVQSWTGGIGKIATDIADQGLTLAGREPRSMRQTLPDQWPDLPVLGTFFGRYPTMQIQPIQDFYDRYAQAQQSYRSARHLWKTDPGRVKAYLASHPEAKFAKGFVKTGKDFAALRKATDRFLKSQKLTPEEKQLVVDKMIARMRVIAERVNKKVAAKEAPLPETRARDAIQQLLGVQ